MKPADLTPVAFVDEGLGNSSYLIDIGDGRAVVVDPSRHPRPYLEEAEQRGLQVAFTVETHLHADFVSGSRELAALGATVVAPAAGGLEFPAGVSCTATASTLAASGCARWQRLVTRRSTSLTCWSRAVNRSLSSREAPSWWAPSPGPT